jgi:hypothetical protein
MSDEYEYVDQKTDTDEIKDLRLRARVAQRRNRDTYQSLIERELYRPFACKQGRYREEQAFFVRTP